ncbi:hypothetical protein Ancab_015182 [Ancistrocladus abbreviatus]
MTGDSLQFHDHRLVSRPSLMEPYGMNENALALRIHCMETEAYSAVLRAFIAQSDLLSWGKEGLMTDLRKELNITDDEHRDILSKIDLDGPVGIIRRLKVSCGPQTTCEMDLLHSQPSSATKPVENVSTRRLKVSYTPRTTCEMDLLHGQPSSARNPVENVSDRRLKVSCCPRTACEMHLPHGQPPSSTNPSVVVGQFKDGHWSGNSLKYIGNAEKALKPVAQDAGVIIMKGRAFKVADLRRGCRPPDGNVGTRSDLIEIRATDKLICEVEKVVFGRESPDPRQVEKAKVVLRMMLTVTFSVRILAGTLSGWDTRWLDVGE